MHDASGLLSLPVEGDFEGWTLLLEFLCHPALTGAHLAMTPDAAFKILPIAHAYDMAGLLRNCVKTMQQSQPPLGQLGPELPPANASGQRPSLLQWLALGDARQCSPLVHACLQQLTSQGEALPVVRSALACPQARAQLDRLCSTTLMELLNVTAGLPHDFKGARVPDLTGAPPSLFKEVPDVGDPHVNGGCLQGSQLLLAQGWAVLVLNVEDGTCFQLGDSGAEVRTVACADDGQRALVGIGRPAVQLWDLGSRQCRNGFHWPSSGVPNNATSVCFCGEHRVAAGSEDGRVRVWDCEGQGLAGFGPDLVGHRGVVFDVKPAWADGDVLLSAGADGQLRLWDLRQRACCVRLLEGHAAAVVSVGVSAGSRTAVSAAFDHSLKQWDVGSGQCVGTLNELANKVYVDRAATAAVSLGADRAIRVWDLSRGTLAQTHSWPTEPLRDLCCSSDLARVAVVGRERGEAGDIMHVKVWSA